MKMISKMGFALLALLLGSTGWGQTSFGKYGPVAGVQMNTGATPYNFAAGITDIQSLLSASPGVVLGGATGGAKGVGSINATALFINGAAVGTSSGAVSSVALGSPGTCFGVTGSPVTSAGTLAYALSGTVANFIRGDGSCSALANADIQTLTPTWTGLNTFNGRIAGTDSSAAGTYGLAYLGAASAARDIFQVGEAGFSNGFTVQYDGTQMKYGFLNGNITVGAPAGGTALAVTGLTGTQAFTVASSAGAAAALAAGWNVGLSANQWDIFSQSTDGLTVGTAGNAGLAFDTNATQRLTINGAGNIVANAPASGVTVTENVVAGATYGHSLSGAASNNVYYQATNGTQNGVFGISGGNILTVGSVSGTELDLVTGGTVRQSVSSSGNVVISTPATGGALTVNGAAGVGVYASRINGSTTASQSFGHLILAGTNASDAALVVNNAANTATYLDIAGNGQFTLGYNGTGSVLSTSAAGNLAVAAPSSGTALQVTDLPGANGAAVTSTSAVGQLAISWGVQFSNAWNIFSTTSDPLVIGTGSAASLTLATNSSSHIVINSAGNVVISPPSSGQALAVSGVANAYAVNFIGSSTTSQSFGLLVNAGTNISDNSFIVQNRSGSVNYLTVHGDGSGGVGSTANALTWSAAGNVGINAPSGGGIAETVIGASSSFAAAFGGSATASNSFGIAIQAGTNSADANLLLQNAAQSVTFAKVFGDGGVVIGAPTGGDKGLGSVNMQSCFVNNQPCLTGSASATRFAAGVMTIAAGSCTVNQNTSNISSCTFNSTGNVTVNFTTSFSATTCVVNGVNGSPSFAVATQQGAPTTTASNVLMQSSSGVFVNGIFSIMCLGN